MGVDPSACAHCLGAWRIVAQLCWTLLLTFKGVVGTDDDGGITPKRAVSGKLRKESARKAAERSSFHCALSQLTQQTGAVDLTVDGGPGAVPPIQPAGEAGLWRTSTGRSQRTPPDLDRRSGLHGKSAAAGLTLVVEWEPNCSSSERPHSKVRAQVRAQVRAKVRAKVRGSAGNRHRRRGGRPCTRRSSTSLLPGQDRPAAQWRH